MSIGVSANRVEMVQQIRAVAEELGIERDIVFRAIEMSYERAGRQQFGAELDVRAKIHRQTGEVTMERATTVVEEVETQSAEITLPEALTRDPAAVIGKVYLEPLPVMDFSRVGAMAGKQIIMQNLREAQRERQFEEFRERVGEVVNGIVKRVEYGNIMIDLGKAEAIIRRNDSIPREVVNPGDRLRAYIYDVRRETRGPQIFLSRAHPDFMRELFKNEVPEVYDGIIEIPHIARDPGSRAKIAVRSKDSSIDPVGACVGMRGSRVQAVVGELAGEKIDIIPFSPDPATFIVNALQPAEVARVVMDEDENRIEVVVPDDQLSLAIGRRGQNVRLASQLTGWGIDIITETDANERRQKEFTERTALFIEALDVDEMVAQLLVTEGFANVEELAYVDIDDLSDIDGFNAETAVELQQRAAEHLGKVAAELDERRRELGVEDALIEIDGLTGAMLVALGEGDVKSVEDLAGLTPDELRGGFEFKNGERVREPGVLETFGLTEEAAQDLIMRARLTAGWISEEDYAAAATSPTEEVEDDEELEDADADLLAELAAAGLDGVDLDALAALELGEDVEAADDETEAETDAETEDGDHADDDRR